MNIFDLSLIQLEATNVVRGLVADFQRQFYLVDELGEEEEEVDYGEGPDQEGLSSTQEVHSEERREPLEDLEQV